MSICNEISKMKCFLHWFFVFYTKKEIPIKNDEENDQRLWWRWYNQSNRGEDKIPGVNLNKSDNFMTESFYFHSKTYGIYFIR